MQTRCICFPWMKGLHGWSKTAVLLLVLLLAILVLAAGWMAKRRARPLEARPPSEAAGPGRAGPDEAHRQAELALRQHLDELEPVYHVNDTVELHRKNGIVDQGLFTGLAGIGPNRVAVLAAPTGEIGVPLIQLESASRRRIDPLYREAYIQHMVRIGGTVPADNPVE